MLGKIMKKSEHFEEPEFQQDEFTKLMMQSFAEETKSKKQAYHQLSFNTMFFQ